MNLLNSHEDPTFLHTVLYFDIARHYIPPKANFVRVVINGESWGLYVNGSSSTRSSSRRTTRAPRGPAGR
ncbi:MAG: CotH kinase family protein [Singulisphaera sp.]